MDLNLPPLPPSMAGLPKDQRGYPVPYFVAWFKDGKPSRRGEGEPDFRVVLPHMPMFAFRNQRCWVCGGFLGRRRVYVIGPMCVVNRVTSEPPSHRECAEFAAKACPFLIRPRQKRDKKGLPEDRIVPGISIDRNPGVVALYEALHAKPFQAGDGVLFRLGEPTRVEFYAYGRIATRAEVQASIESGYPILLAMAEKEGAEAIRELTRMAAAAMCLLPAT